MITEEQVLDALRNIIDPDLQRDIVSLGFVKDLSIQGGAVRFSIELTTPACPVKAKFQADAEAAVRSLPGVESVSVTMTAQQRKPRPELQKSPLKQVATIIAVSSCKGGVGKSTVAALLARAIQREGHSVGLLDLDIYGPSLPTLLRVPFPEVYMRGEQILPIEVDGLKTMSMGYLIGDKPAVMRGPMAANYTLQILHQTDWGKLDYLIIDLPPGTGDIQLSLTQQAEIDGAIMVTTPQALSLVDVARGILMFEKVNVPVLGIVENMAYFVCDNCDKKHYIFGDPTATLKDRFGLDTLAQLPLIPGLSDASTRDAGSEFSAFASLADHLHRAVGKRRAEGTEGPVAEAIPGAIQVRWPDGFSAQLPNKQVRASCRCALCVQEMTGEALLDPETIPDDITVESLSPLGHYALAITWSDGHSSGIFSWEHLRGLAESKTNSCGGGCACGGDHH
jgi:ATP-binding protein involved in chromosome partitioning